MRQGLDREIPVDDGLARIPCLQTFGEFGGNPGGLRLARGLEVRSRIVGM